MNHRRARRRLAGLADGLLAPAEEAAVRAHVEVCRRCRRIVAEHAAVESLLRRIPASVLPLDASRAGDGRLLTLARWAPSPREPSLVWKLPALSAMAVTMVVWMLVGMGPDLPARGASVARERPRQVVLAARIPVSFAVPDLAGPTATVPYTLRQ